MAGFNSSDRDRWLLPDGVEEVLPQDAWRMEQQRRLLVETFHSWGFDLVMPPMVEYLDSLLTGAGEELATRTFTVTDQLTGRLMGIRADMTPQVARIDAHYMASADITHTRLCYAGSTLQTLPRTLGGSREPFQFGAELFGVSEPEGDCEIVTLMTECMQVLGLSGLTLDLGHVGVFRALAEHYGADDHAQNQILNALITKSSSDIEMAVSGANLGDDATHAFAELTGFVGDTGVIEQARACYREVPALLDALTNLQQVVELVERFCPRLDLSIDLAELRGYRYHTGIAYSLLAPGAGKPVARGGRYDGVGLAFGRARPATGFSGDLRQLLNIGSGDGRNTRDYAIVAAPFSSAPELEAEIRKLRGQGYRVQRLLPGQSTSSIPGLSFELVPDEHASSASPSWKLVSVSVEQQIQR